MIEEIENDIESIRHFQTALRIPHQFNTYVLETIISTLLYIVLNILKRELKGLK